MSSSNELFNELVIDHSSKPRNFRQMEGANRHLEGHNPLCGDKLTIYVTVEDDLVKDVSFQGRHQNCAISTASASMMTQILKGKTRAEAENLCEKFRSFVTGKVSEKEVPELGKLLFAFSHLKEKPLRVKCATLPWHTFQAALEDKAAPVSTE